MFSFTLLVCPHCDFRCVQANGIISGKASGYIECPECGVLMERPRDATRKEVKSLPFLRQHSATSTRPRSAITSPRIQPLAPPPPADQSDGGQGAGLDSIPEDKPLTAREAAKIIGKSYNLFNKVVRAGEIGYVEHNGRERRFYRRHLEEYLKSKLVRPKPNTEPVVKKNQTPSRNRVSQKKQRSKSEWREMMKDW